MINIAVVVLRSRRRPHRGLGRYVSFRTVEGLPAPVLRRFGLRFLTVRGLKKIRAVLLLAALAHNLFRVEAIRQEQATAVA